MFIERDGRVDALEVTSSRQHAGRWVIGFEGVETMNDAETLRDTELRIAPEALRALEAGRFYVTTCSAAASRPPRERPWVR